MPSFNLALFQQADALCRDDPAPSPEYAVALGVQPPVLAAQFALMATSVPGEPAAAHLPATVTDLLRQRLRLELHCMGRGDMGPQGQCSLLRALAATDAGSLETVAHLGDTKTIQSMLVWQGLPNNGYTPGMGWHGTATVKNGDPLLTVGDMTTIFTFHHQLGEARKAAAAAPGGPTAPPKVAFSTRLETAGYAGLPPPSRPSQTMVGRVLKERTDRWRVCPYLVTKVEPWTDPSWSRAPGGSAVTTRQCLAGVSSELASISGGAFNPTSLVAASAVTAAAKMANAHDPAGSWWAAVSRLVHSLAAASSFGPGGMGTAAAKMANAHDPAGSWWAAVSRLVHSLAVASSFGPGGMGTAVAYLSSLSVIAARGTFALVKEYDQRLRQQAAASEELDEPAVAAMFAAADHALLALIQGEAAVTAIGNLRANHGKEKGSPAGPRHDYGSGGRAQPQGSSGTSSRFRKRRRQSPPRVSHGGAHTAPPSSSSAITPAAPSGKGHSNSKGRGGGKGGKRF